jgi:hypothetical protein
LFRDSDSDFEFARRRSTRIPRHNIKCGPYKGSPSPTGKRAKSLFFDDIFEREVWNETDWNPGNFIYGRPASASVSYGAAQSDDHQSDRGVAFHT